VTLLLIVQRFDSADCQFSNPFATVDLKYYCNVQFSLSVKPLPEEFFLLIRNFLLRLVRMAFNLTLRENDFERLERKV
jgi:hypothetical protein